MKTRTSRRSGRVDIDLVLCVHLRIEYEINSLCEHSDVASTVCWLGVSQSWIITSIPEQTSARVEIDSERRNNSSMHVSSSTLRYLEDSVPCVSTRGCRPLLTIKPSIGKSKKKFGLNSHLQGPLKLLLLRDSLS